MDKKSKIAVGNGDTGRKARARYSRMIGARLLVLGWITNAGRARCSGWPRSPVAFVRKSNKSCIMTYAIYAARTRA